MDNHVATQCRRAKRSKAKLLDISCLGLPRWNADIFGLSELETLKINDNSLTEIPADLSRLTQLTALDVSNNKIEKLPSFDFGQLQNLSSIRLDGNPFAQNMSATLLKQLANPEQVAGKSKALVLREAFQEASRQPGDIGTAAEPNTFMEQSRSRSGNVASITTPFAPKPPEIPPESKQDAGKSLSEYMKDLGGSDEEYSDDFHESEDDAKKQLSKRAEPADTRKSGGTSVLAFKKPADDSDDEAPRLSRKTASTHSAVGKVEPIGIAPPVKPSTSRVAGGSGFDDGRRAESGRSSRRVTGETGREETTGRHKAKSSNADADGDAEVTRMLMQKPDADAEIARLQAQVKELKAQVASANKTSESKSSDDSTKARLASTLPSRLHAFDDDGSDKLKQQLQEEQRRAKRLERDNQKLQDRMRESSMSSGSASAPHVELSEIQEGEILSKSGGFSIIYKGTWHGTPVAIKKLFDPSNSPENLAELDNEVDKLGKLRHPNILSLLAVHRKPPVYSILLEVITGGSLFQLLHSKHSFSFAPGVNPAVSIEALVRIDESMALALSFMHARNVVHRDVKSHNVLLSPHLEAKLCDFGLARMKSDLMTGAMQFAGTPNYMAPELLRQQKYTEKVDVWALGVLLWETIEHDIPFANLDVPEIRGLVTSGKMLQMTASSPRPIQSVIKSCWTVDSLARPAMPEVQSQLRAFLS